MKLKKIGFYKELKHGIKYDESLKESVCLVPQVNEGKIIEYLENGVIYCISPGLIKDILDESEPIIGSLKLLTDGEWVWPSDLPYYVKKYHVKLKKDFLLHVQARNWILDNKQEFCLEKLEL